MIEPREYQHKMINDIRQAIREGNKRIIGQAWVGSGKTVIAAEIMKLAKKNFKHSLFLAPRRQLVYQSAETFRAYDLSTGIIMAGEPRSSMPFVQVGSVDTITRRMSDGKIQLPRADILIVDEAHAMMSPKRLELFNQYPIVIGFTSTPALANGKGMGSFYSKIVEGPSMQWMVDNKFLVPMRYFAADAPDLSAVKLNSDGDYQESALAEASDKPELIGGIYDNYKRIAGDRPTLIFAVNCAHGRHIHQEFLRRGVKTDYIDGDTSTEDRDAIKARVFSGETKVVVNILVMAFGTDWAPFSCVIIARATRNISAWIQMIGRGSRLYDKKDDCIVIYHGDNFSELGAIDEPIQWSLDDKTTIKERKEQAKKERQEPKDITCRTCGRVFKGSRICPRCGDEMIPPGEPIPFHKADLVEIKPEKVTPEQKKQFYAELLGYCRRYNKPDKMALAIFRERYKEWPYGKYSVKPEAPTPKTMQYITSRHIAYAKRKTVA